MANWLFGGTVTISKDSSKKHYYKTNVGCSCVTNYIFNNDGYLSGYFSPNGSVFEFGSHVPSHTSESQNETLSGTIPNTSQWNTSRESL